VAGGTPTPADITIGGALRQVVVALVPALAFVACATPAPSPVAPTSSEVPPGPSEVELDQGLLDVLPQSVDGLPLEPSPEGVAQALDDPAVDRDVQSIGAGIIAGADGQFAYSTVARLRPNVMSDEFFRDWRDSWDEAACEPAGGVAGHAEAEIDGRQIFIGTCSAGLRTYHTHLPGRNLLVSISSLGDLRLGERLLEDLED
jgi:hypothetical protein